MRKAPATANAATLFGAPFDALGARVRRGGHRPASRHALACKSVARPLAKTLLLTLALCLAPSSTARANPTKGATGAVAQLQKAVSAFRAGDYDLAARTATRLLPLLPRSRDYVLYIAAESEFYAGRERAALPLWKRLAADKSSRLAPLAAYRAADCSWSLGERADAVAAYRRLLQSSAEGERPVPKIDRVRMNALIAEGVFPPDTALGRFRIATLLAEPPAGKTLDAKLRARAARAFRSIHLEYPAHPLAADAGRRAVELEPPSAPPPGLPTPVGNDPAQQSLIRAGVLHDQRRFEDAVAELERLPGGLPASVEAERKYLIGMSEFRMRRNYARAAEMLLAAAPGLLGDKAATAEFHGTRSLSRVHRDDDAIAGYRRFVERHPGSRYAAEASFLSGWLNFNRGRYREALGPFDETTRRFARSTFATDAAWFAALGRLLLGEGEPALAALDRYARLVPQAKDPGDAARRTTFYRGRALMLVRGREAEARGLWEGLARQAPFSYYGMLARVRLRASGQPLPLSLPAWTGQLPAPTGAPDALIARVDELDAGGLSREASIELARGERDFMRRRGKERALPWLLDRYARTGGFRRAYQLADAYGDAALASAPEGSARTFWTAAYPRAFAEIVDRTSPLEDNPEFMVLSIMQKESAYLPTEVSYADARGLMQMLPERGAELAAEIGQTFSDEELFLPPVSIRLGARYTGLLASKFRGDIALAAGAYNAGGRALARFCDSNGKRQLDDFIELVTYEQTREYMKKLLAIYARYHYLYKGRAFEPELNVAGCQYDPKGREN